MEPDFMVEGLKRTLFFFIVLRPDTRGYISKALCGKKRAFFSKRIADLMTVYITALA